MHPISIQDPFGENGRTDDNMMPNKLCATRVAPSQNRVLPMRTHCVVCLDAFACCLSCLSQIEDDTRAGSGRVDLLDVKGRQGAFISYLTIVCAHMSRFVSLPGWLHAAVDNIANIIP